MKFLLSLLMIVPFDAVECLLSYFWCVNVLALWKLETVCLLLFNFNPASRCEQKLITFLPRASSSVFISAWMIHWQYSVISILHAWSIKPVYIDVKPFRSEHSTQPNSICIYCTSIYSQHWIEAIQSLWNVQAAHNWSRIWLHISSFVF